MRTVDNRINPYEAPGISAAVPAERSIYFLGRPFIFVTMAYSVFAYSTVFLFQFFPLDSLPLYIKGALTVVMVADAAAHLGLWQITKTRTLAFSIALSMSGYIHAIVVSNPSDSTVLRAHMLAATLALAVAFFFLPLRERKHNQFKTLGVLKVIISLVGWLIYYANTHSLPWLRTAASFLNLSASIGASVFLILAYWSVRPSDLRTSGTSPNL